jgi:2-iminobutanoate/2-iminopropanoate deaminase
MCNKRAFSPGRGVVTGPYSPAVVVGEHVYIAGQGPVVPESGEIVEGTFDDQALLTFDNVARALQAADCTLDDCVKVTVYLSDMANYDRMNGVYAKMFSEPFPARTTVQAVLWHHIQIEIDVIAIHGCAATGAQR